MRLKPDGSLDLDWREQPSRKWKLTKQRTMVAQTVGGVERWTGTTGRPAKRPGR
jgi:hypothetical protein